MKPKHSCCPLIEAMMTCVEHDRTGVVKASVKIGTIISHNRPFLEYSQIEVLRLWQMRLTCSKGYGQPSISTVAKAQKNPVILLHYMHIHVTYKSTTKVKYIYIYRYHDGIIKCTVHISTSLIFYTKCTLLFSAPGSTCVSSFHRCDGYLSISAEASSSESSTPRLRFIHTHCKKMSAWW